MASCHGTIPDLYISFYHAHGKQPPFVYLVCTFRNSLKAQLKTTVPVLTIYTNNLLLDKVVSHFTTHLEFLAKRLIELNQSDGEELRSFWRPSRSRAATAVFTTFTAQTHG